MIAGVLIVTALARFGPDDEALAADMRTGTGAIVGHVALRDDEPSTVTVNVPGWTELLDDYSEPVNATYWLAVEVDDGTREVHPLPPDDDDHTWVIELDSDPDAIATVSVLDDEGRVWCTARFAA